MAGWVAALGLVIAFAVIAPARQDAPPPTSPATAAPSAARSVTPSPSAPTTLADALADPFAPPPGTARVYPVVYGPMGIALGLESVWVVTAKDLRLRRINPNDDQEMAVIDLPFVTAAPRPGTTPLATASDETAFSTVGAGTSLEGSGIVPGVAVAGGSVWVFGVPQPDAIIQIDPGTNAVVRTLRLSWPVTGVVSGPSGTWVTTDHGVIISIDTARGRVGRAITVGAGRVAAAAGMDATWVSSGSGRTLRIDATGRVTARIVAGGGPIAIADGSVWIAARGFLTQVDEHTGNVVAREEIGTSGDAALVRRFPSIGPTDYRARDSLVAPRGSSVAESATTIWLCRPERGEVWRLAVPQP